jgi:hypothetical protein
MTLRDIDIWTENWLEQTGQQTRPSNSNGHERAGGVWEEFQIG